MQYISLICFWLFIFIIIFTKNDLRPLWKGKNAFVMMISGILTFWFFKTSVFSSLRTMLILLIPTDYIPFYDQISTTLALVTYEEASKGIMIFFLLLSVRLVNPKVSMQWAMVIVPLYISNIFSWNETMRYYQADMNNTFWMRILFPVHIIFQIPMIFILFKYYHLVRGKIWQIFVFCGSVCAAIGCHFLWNVCTMLDNDLYKYMVANTHYSILYYVCGIVKIVTATLLGIFLAYLALDIFSNRQCGSWGEQFLKKANNALVELKGRGYLFPATSAIIIALFIAFGLKLYGTQDIKPLRMIGGNRELMENNMEAYVDGTYNPVKINLATLPLVQTIKKGKIKRSIPYNFNLQPELILKSTGVYRICTYQNKQYLSYENVVIGFLPIMSKEAIVKRSLE